MNWHPTFKCFINTDTHKKTNSIVANWKPTGWKGCWIANIFPSKGEPLQVLIYPNGFDINEFPFRTIKSVRGEMTSEKAKSEALRWIESNIEI